MVDETSWKWTCNGHDDHELAERLQAYFPPEDLEFKPDRFIQIQGGLKAVMLAYVTNRAIQQRLDDVCGPGNWRNEYERWNGTGVLCTISLRFECTPGEQERWVSKRDGADESKIEATKGGLSNAMKRCAVQWGIGRYLYRFPDSFCDAVEVSGKNRLKKWGDRPSIPQQFMPEGTKPQPKPNGNGNGSSQPAPQGNGGAKPKPNGARQSLDPPAVTRSAGNRELVCDLNDISEEAWSAAQLDGGRAQWLSENSFPFGAHKGKTWHQFLEAAQEKGDESGHYGYLEWSLANLHPHRNGKGEEIRKAEWRLEGEIRLARCIAILEHVDGAASFDEPAREHLEPDDSDWGEPTLRDEVTMGRGVDDDDPPF